MAQTKRIATFDSSCQHWQQLLCLIMKQFDNSVLDIKDQEPHKILEDTSET